MSMTIFVLYLKRQKKHEPQNQQTLCGGTRSLVFFSSSAGLCTDNTRQLMGWPKVVNGLWEKKSDLYFDNI